MDKFSEGAKASLANCFVPELLMEYIRKNVRQGKEKMEPASFFLDGVCLLVDISGFTMMSERFCTEGKSGIDNLQLATNGYMGKLVEVIYAYGGDIMKFAGDALICVFSSDFTIDTTSKGKVRREGNNPNVSVDVILRAMHCAHVIRSVQTDSLSVHVAMSCGEMCFGILGGVENRWECLISGPCIRELSDCLDDAPSKEAAISPGCAAVLNQHLVRPAEIRDLNGQSVEHCRVEADSGDFEFQLVTLPSGNRRIIYADCVQQRLNRKTSDQQNVAVLTSSRQKTIIDKLVRQFVPAPIADELENATGLSSYFAEIREVVTMFMKWDSYDADGKHRDLLELQACFYQAQRILHSTGAYLRQFLVDDKGCVLIGCWGMPNMSYIDNAYRALSAAAQIRQELGRLGMETSVGITAGDVYCGTVGSERRMEYAAIGTIVNMSARLMSKAKGRLLIGDTAHGRLPKTAHGLLEEIEPMMVKGRATALQAYEYVATHSTKAQGGFDNGEIPAGCRQALLSLLQDMLKEQVSPRCVAPAVEAAPDSPMGGAAASAAEKKSNKGSDKEGDKFGDATANRSEKTDRTLLNFSARPSRQSSSLSSTRSKPGASPSQFAGNLSNLLRFGRTSSAQLNVRDRLPVVLLNGKEGSGRTSVVVWLKAQAVNQKIPVIGAKITKKESSIDFHVWKKLFQQLMPKDMFQNNATQRSYAMLLLKKVYAATPQLAETVGFPALKQTLGVSCNFADDSESTDSSPKKSLKKGNWSQSMVGMNLMAVKNKPRALEALLNVPLQETLFKVFTYLLNQQPTLVVLENMELADEESMKLLIELMTAANLRSTFVLTALIVDAQKLKKMRIGQFMFTRTHESDAFLNTPWSKQYRKAIQDLRCTITVVLEKYTVQDIEKMLAAALGSRAVKPDMAKLVQEFSGGSCFWVREIIQSIKDNGVEQFMSAINGGADDSTGDAANGVLGSGKGGGGFEASFRVKRNSVSGGPTPRASTTRIAGNARASTKVGQLSRAASSNQIDNTFSQMKLDKLVLCRFNNLSADIQRILRTASVIGATFSGSILYGVLSKHLKELMNASVDVLLAQKWIYQDTENETMYHFAHAHSHKIIYQLTPSSERNNIHLLIAEYIEDKYGDDKAQYAALSYHYQHCDTEKALEYCGQATAVLLETDVIFDYGDCLDLLFGSYPCCKTAAEIDVLIKLTRQVRTSLENLRVSSQGSGKTQGWLLSGLFSILRSLSTVSGRGTGSNSSSYKVSPTPSSTASSGKQYDTSTDDGDGETDLGADGEVDYELRTKRMFLSQLDRLNDQLYQKLSTVNATTAAAAGSATGSAYTSAAPSPSVSARIKAMTGLTSTASATAGAPITSGSGAGTTSPVMAFDSSASSGRNSPFAQ